MARSKRNVSHPAVGAQVVADSTLTVQWKRSREGSDGSTFCGRVYGVATIRNEEPVSAGESASNGPRSGCRQRFLRFQQEVVRCVGHRFVL